MLSESWAWIHPLSAARNLARSQETCWTLLYSGQRLAHSGRFSYIFLLPQETIFVGDFTTIAVKLSHDKPLFANAWVGYFGYEMLHATEKFTPEPRKFIGLPPSCFTRFGIILQFDHEEKQLTCHRDASCSVPAWLMQHSPQVAFPVPIAEITSSFSRAQYLQAVADTREAIARGEFYQANITRKFTGHFTEAPDKFHIFELLSEASPSAYSAFVQNGARSILSSSPERFLAITPGGRIETRPIKGTAPRLSDPAADAAQRAKLEHSEKDRAENLMIVDLMRNDLSRACITGSVQVDRLFEVTSYATLHHLDSTISGQKRNDVSTLGVIESCFPPGSMTGTPKIRAIDWCMQKENIQRGVYSGALGWFGGDGSCDFSVVIRTLLIEDARFEFQVGGGIIADSDPESEWRETLTKARGILVALGIDGGILEAL